MCAEFWDGERRARKSIHIYSFDHMAEVFPNHLSPHEMKLKKQKIVWLKWRLEFRWTRGIVINLIYPSNLISIFAFVPKPSVSVLEHSKISRNRKGSKKPRSYFSELANPPNQNLFSYLLNAWNSPSKRAMAILYFLTIIPLREFAPNS